MLQLQAIKFIEMELICNTVNTRYTDYDLEPGTYSYYVKAFDASGNVSDVSNTVVFDNQPPTAPENVFVTSVTTTSVSLEWTESTDNIGVADTEYTVTVSI